MAQDEDTAASRLRALITPQAPLSAAEKLSVVGDLFELGCELHRAKLRRARPDASADEIERLLVAWLRERPGAEDGDGVGRAVPWPRDGGA